jgi:hypothetical protein
MFYYFLNLRIRIETPLYYVRECLNINFSGSRCTSRSGNRLQKSPKAITFHYTYFIRKTLDGKLSAQKKKTSDSTFSTRENSELVETGKISKK